KFMELGTAADPSLATGWLGRHVGAMPPLQPGTLLRGMAIGAALPQLMAGGPGVIPAPDPAHAGLAGVAATSASRTAWLGRTYGRTAEPVATAAANSLATQALLGRI